MKLRPIIGFAALGLASLAAASIMTVWSAMGEGAVTDNMGRVARFRLGMNRAEHKGASRTGGTAFLDTSNRERRGPQLTIQVDEMGVTESAANFAGPAVLRVPKADGTWAEFVGRGRGQAISRRHPGEDGEPDSLVMEFTREGGPDFGFGGRITMGDISVAKTTSY